MNVDTIAADADGRVQAPIVPVIGDIIRQVPGTISLGQGVVHYGPPPAALDAVRDALADPATHEYQDGAGLPALVERARAEAARPKTASTSARGSRIMVTAGANMAFMHAVLAITAPGDEIILHVPFYFNHEMAIEMAGCTRGPRRRPTIAISCASTRCARRSPIARAPSSRCRRTIRAARCFSEASLRDGQRAVPRARASTTSPTRSTSTSPTARRGTCRRASFPGADAHTISMYSLSKAYGFAGWRIGYMVYPEHLASAMMKSQDTILVCPPVASQIGGDRRARRRPRATASRTSASSPSIRDIVVSRAVGARAAGQRAGGRRRVLLRC